MPRAECAWPATPQSVRSARRFVEEQLDDWGASGHAWAAITVVSELATNAVLHARTEFVVAIELDGPRLHVRVADGAAAIPVRRRYEVEAATGRGIALLEALASDWGIEASDGGKVVWCTVEAHRDSSGDVDDDMTDDVLLGTFADAHVDTEWTALAA
ncbi:MAG: putative anti-sigma regulatory factor, serine/threonine protein kinase [Frankiales bacterium]|nr:putative anti-sigma regulatory factor, serine/threonine protein kinase [Frankiales bacterium]